MPELPEVENIARAMRESLLGRRLDALSARFAGAMKPSPAAARRALLGRRLTGIRRHGKYLFLDFSPDQASPHVREASPVYGRAAGAERPAPARLDRAAVTAAATSGLMLHLRMTGQVFVDPAYVPDKHVRLVFDFEGLTVYYRDQRKFGGFTLLAPDQEAAALARVGPDMLEIPFPRWQERLAGRRAPIKALLLDQRIAAGLGNIYADEALFRARVHPSSEARALETPVLRRIWREARGILRLGIRHGGTTFINFIDFRGKPGGFRRQLRVYGRDGQPCVACGAPIAKIKVGGRGTHFCPRCQSLFRRLDP